MYFKLQNLKLKQKAPLVVPCLTLMATPGIHSMFHPEKYVCTSLGGNILLFGGVFLLKESHKEWLSVSLILSKC